MRKTIEILVWLQIKIFNIFIEIISLFNIHKNKDILLFGNKPNSNKKDLFSGNTKYLFLYTTNLTNIESIWLCDDKYMLKEFRARGYKNVISRNSFKGIMAVINAKFWFSNVTSNQVSKFNSRIGRQILINFWHGIPLKKIQADDKSWFNIKNRIIQFLDKDSNYYIVNGNYEQQCYTTAFQKDKEFIKILGSPRLDVLLNDIPNADLFMEKDFEIIKAFKQNGKKLFIYMPTWRDTGANVSCWLKSEKLREFLKQNNIIFICKLHPYDKNSNNIKSDETIYIMDNESDVYPILKYTDSLITDYSSVYFDYLLIDKPILYFVPDLEEYQEKCRGFYRPFEELTAGIKVYNEEELMNAMQDIVNGIDNYKEKRKILRDEMFKYQDGKNCERAMEFIRSLD